MPSRFPTGYVRDAEDYGYPSHRKLIAALPGLLPTANHLPYRIGPIWQDGVGMCVGTAFKRCVQLWQQMAGLPAEFMVSAKFAYDTGRAAEYAGINPDVAPDLIDRGSQPGLVLRAAQQVGLVLDTDHPDPTSHGWDPAAVNRRPTPDVLVKAYSGRGLQFYRVTPGVDGFRAAIRACMVRSQPVMFSMFVDTGIMLNTGAIVTAIYEDDPDGGGHMLTVLDASREDYVVLDNWWDSADHGIDWGMPAGNLLQLPRGTWRISWALLERAIIQCFAVSAVPFIRTPKVVAP